MKMTGFFDNNNFGASLFLTIFFEGVFLFIDASCKLGLFESLLNIGSSLDFGIVAFLFIVLAFWLVVNTVCQIFDVYGKITRRMNVC